MTTVIYPIQAPLVMRKSLRKVTVRFEKIYIDLGYLMSDSGSDRKRRKAVCPTRKVTVRLVKLEHAGKEHA